MVPIDKIEVRNLNIEDFSALISDLKSLPNEELAVQWSESQIKKLLGVFPEGQIVVLVNGMVVGYSLSIILSAEQLEKMPHFREITGNFSFTTHQYEGDLLYGLDTFVLPKFRGLRLGRRLSDVRKEWCEERNLSAIITYSRMPKQVGESLKNPKDYIRKVKYKELQDLILGFHLANDFHIKTILPDYFSGDKEQTLSTVILEWNNIFYQKRTREISYRTSVVRVGLIQWQMRLFPSMDALCEQIEYFVDSVASYTCDFMLFPELFNAPLMAEFNNLSEPEAIRELSAFTIPLRDKFLEYAVSYNVNIVTGSMPLIENGQLLNVGYLCRRDGTFERYEKIHITPAEVDSWGMAGGSKMEVFDTDSGKIAVAICYDVEFPEMCRILADKGMQILFVPFLTDTQNGYMRVRYCAQARAIENECYVVMAGCVGNLPQVHNMDIQYAQSAVLTPSDFAFPSNAVKGEATPNTEMTLIVDIDLDLLRELHEYGSVRNMKDRRLELYEIKPPA
jgi:predicted amidohydrolase/GNAT superfamily N-acetyltransferase